MKPGWGQRVCCRGGWKRWKRSGSESWLAARLKVKGKITRSRSGSVHPHDKKNTSTTSSTPFLMVIWVAWKSWQILSTWLLPTTLEPMHLNPFFFHRGCRDLSNQRKRDCLSGLLLNTSRLRSHANRAFFALNEYAQPPFTQSSPEEQEMCLAPGKNPYESI